MHMSEHIPGQGIKSPKSWVSHLGIAGGLVAALAIVDPVKNFFWTREEGLADRSRIERLEKMSERFLEIPTRPELAALLNQSTDRITQSVTERDLRNNSRIDQLEQTFNRRIDLLLQDKLNNKGR